MRSRGPRRRPRRSTRRSRGPLGFWALIALLLFGLLVVGLFAGALAADAWLETVKCGGGIP